MTVDTTHALLKLVDIDVSFAHRQTLDKVAMDIELGGRLTGLLGPNGAGKSTLFKCITGFERSYRGSISIDGHALDRYSPSQRSQLGIGYLPQESWLFKDMSVEENLLLVGQLQKKPDLRNRKEVDEALSEMGLSDLRANRAAHLSGGEKRRLEFARTLLMQPKIMLLDEPFAGVDPKTIKEISQIIYRMIDKGISIVISDHHAEKILNLADIIHVMDAGVIIQSGNPEEIKSSALAKKVYLGFD